MTALEQFAPLIALIIGAAIYAAGLALRNAARRLAELTDPDRPQPCDVLAPAPGDCLLCSREDECSCKPCPWCTDRACADDSLCHCPAPCGKSYCKRLSVAGGVQ